MRCAADQGKYWQYHDEISKNSKGEYVSWVTTDVLKQFASNVPLLIEGAKPYSVFRQVVEKVQSSYMKNVLVLLIPIRQDSVYTYSNHSYKDLPRWQQSPNRAFLPRSQFAALRTMALLGKRNFSAGELLLALSN